MGPCLVQELRKKHFVAKISPTEFMNQVKAETAKVYWPSRRETVMTAIMVVALTLILGIFFFVVDWGFSRIVKLLLSLVQG
jgi:preprotein translocase subunit SecE